MTTAGWEDDDLDDIIDQVLHDENDDNGAQESKLRVDPTENLQAIASSTKLDTNKPEMLGGWSEDELQIESAPESGPECSHLTATITGNVDAETSKHVGWDDDFEIDSIQSSDQEKPEVIPQDFEKDNIKHSGVGWDDEELDLNRIKFGGGWSDNDLQISEIESESAESEKELLQEEDQVLESFEPKHISSLPSSTIHLEDRIEDIDINERIEATENRTETFLPEDKGYQAVIDIQSAILPPKKRLSEDSRQSTITDPVARPSVDELVENTDTAVGNLNVENTLSESIFEPESIDLTAEPQQTSEQLSILNDRVDYLSDCVPSLNCDDEMSSQHPAFSNETIKIESDLASIEVNPNDSRATAAKSDSENDITSESILTEGFSYSKKDIPVILEAEKKDDMDHNTVQVHSTEIVHDHIQTHSKLENCGWSHDDLDLEDDSPVEGQLQMPGSAENILAGTIQDSELGIVKDSETSENCIADIASGAYSVDQTGWSNDELKFKHTSDSDIAVSEIDGKISDSHPSVNMNIEHNDPHTENCNVDRIIESTPILSDSPISGTYLNTEKDDGENLESEIGSETLQLNQAPLSLEAQAIPTKFEHAGWSNESLDLDASVSEQIDEIAQDSSNLESSEALPVPVQAENSASNEMMQDLAECEGSIVPEPLNVDTENSTDSEIRTMAPAVWERNTYDTEHEVLLESKLTSLHYGEWSNDDLDIAEVNDDTIHRISEETVFNEPFEIKSCNEIVHDYAVAGESINGTSPDIEKPKNEETIVAAQLGLDEDKSLETAELVDNQLEELKDAIETSNGQNYKDLNDSLKEDEGSDMPNLPAEINFREYVSDLKNEVYEDGNLSESLNGDISRTSERRNAERCPSPSDSPGFPRRSLYDINEDSADENKVGTDNEIDEIPDIQLGDQEHESHVDVVESRIFGSAEHGREEPTIKLALNESGWNSGELGELDDLETEFESDQGIVNLSKLPVESKNQMVETYFNQADLPKPEDFIAPAPRASGWDNDDNLDTDDIDNEKDEDAVVSPTLWFTGVIKSIGAKTSAGLDKIANVLEADNDDNETEDEKFKSLFDRKPSPSENTSEEKFKALFDKVATSPQQEHQADSESNGGSQSIDSILVATPAESSSGSDKKFKGLFDSFAAPDDNLGRVMGKLGRTTMHIASNTRAKLTPAVINLASRVKQRMTELPKVKISIDDLDEDMRSLLFAGKNAYEYLETIQITSCKSSIAVRKHYRGAKIPELFRDDPTTSASDDHATLSSTNGWSHLESKCGIEFPGEIKMEISRILIMAGSSSDSVLLSFASMDNPPDLMSPSLFRSLLLYTFKRIVADYSRSCLGIMCSLASIDNLNPDCVSTVIRALISDFFAIQDMASQPNSEILSSFPELSSDQVAMAYSHVQEHLDINPMLIILREVYYAFEPICNASSVPVYVKS